MLIHFDSYPVEPLSASKSIAGLWLAGKEGMEKKMETTIMGHIGTTIRVHSFIPG